MKQCPTCKSFYPADDDFCPNDGSVLIDTSASFEQNIPTQVITPAPGGGGRASPVWIYAVAGALGAVVLLGGAYIFLQGNGKTAKEDFVSVSGPSGSPAAGGMQAANRDQNRPVEIASPSPPSPALSPTGHWTGDWSSPSGAYLTIGVDLDDDGAGGTTGRIEWTLRRTMRPEKMSKIGMSATEYVSGRFDPVTRTLSIKGYRKDDPNNVLVMVDSYRLVLSADSRRLSGTARNGGKWNAAVNLSR